MSVIQFPPRGRALVEQMVREAVESLAREGMDDPLPVTLADRILSTGQWQAFTEAGGISYLREYYHSEGD